MSRRLKHISFLLTSYFYFLTSPMNAHAQAGEWTWMKGDSSLANTVWGTQGVPDLANNPPGLYESASWTDHDGNFWLFGGINISSLYSALWKYDPVTNMWTWVKGPSTVNQTGNYGSMGIPSLSNQPGARGWGTFTWVDANGDLWMYGGWGYDIAGSQGPMSDLWRYHIATNEWTWMSGPSVASVNPVYGTFHTFSSSVNPGMRCEASSSWIDSNDNLWLYGGEINSYGLQHASIFRYDPAINQWAWWNGSTSYTQNVVANSVGIFDTLNTPGSRQAYAEWLDQSGLFWLFGGKVGPNNGYADMWNYDPAINKWAFMGGSTIPNNLGVAGNMCEDSSLFFPSSRYENKACWTDSCGNFWMLDGVSVSSFESYSGLWCFQPTENKWTWVSSDLTPGLIGTYGIKGFSSPNNKPTSRFGASSFIDKSNNLWLFGGWVTGIDYHRNDLWRFVIDPSCPALTNCVINITSNAFAASDTLLCEKFCIDFFDSSSNNPTSWLWEFPGGAPASSILQNPTNICYDNPGSYDVTLITTNSSGNDTLTLPDYITVYATPPFPVITQNGNTLTSSPAPNYQWQFNSVDIAGATSQSYTVTQTGFYTVVISDSNGCVNSTTLFVEITGIENLFSDQNISIYPNPSNGTFMIVWSNCSMVGSVSIEIRNTLGQLVFSSEESISMVTSQEFKKEIDLGNTPGGVYFIELSERNTSGITVSSQVIKKLMMVK